MSSLTPGQIARRVARQLEVVRPDLKVASTEGERMGNIRLLRLTLRDGRFAQFSAPELGTHYGRLINLAVAEASRVFPRRKA